MQTYKLQTIGMKLDKDEAEAVNLIPNKCAYEENIFKTARSSAQPAKWLGDLNDQKLFLICICLAPTIIPLGGQNSKL